MPLIIKPLRPPLYLLQIEALNRRLPHTHRLKEEIDMKARNLRAGYNGEYAIQFPLQFLPDQHYHVFYNLRILDPHGYFQIDTLILTPNFLLIIEVKNIKGQVIFDNMGQTIRIDNEMEQAFKNPINQIKLQHVRLQRWLTQFNLPVLPLEKLVVYTNSSTILKNLTNNKETAELVIPIDRLTERIEVFSTKHDFTRLTDDQLTELSFQLLTAHTEENDNILEKYDIPYNHLIKGVSCPSCHHTPMGRKSAKWHCIHCQKSAKDAHRMALADYALLVNRYINNRQARDFLQLSSANIMKKLLKKENLATIGEYSGRKYVLEVEGLL